MTVTIELSGDGGDYWQPDTAQLGTWSEAALRIAGHDTEVEISVCLVDSIESARLNQDYRGKPAPTNVLSFPVTASAAAEQPEPAPLLTTETGLPLLGDLVICPEVVDSEASAQNKRTRDHWAHLVIHGVLHLLGHIHDTEEQAAAMESLEIEALQKLGISNPYLVG